MTKTKLWLLAASLSTGCVAGDIDCYVEGWSDCANEQDYGASIGPEASEYEVWMNSSDCEFTYGEGWSDASGDGYCDEHEDR